MVKKIIVLFSLFFVFHLVDLKSDVSFSSELKYSQSIPFNDGFYQMNTVSVEKNLKEHKTTVSFPVYTGKVVVKKIKEYDGKIFIYLNTKEEDSLFLSYGDINIEGLFDVDEVEIFMNNKKISLS